MTISIKIQGAKAGMGGAKQPSIAKDTASSIAYATILYGLSEGEISGVVDGAKSIYLDDTPIINSDGNPNFVDDKKNNAVTWDFRTGTNDQDYIKGFPAVENETSINVELKSASPWVRAVSNSQLSAVRLRLAWDALQKQDSKGNVTGVTIDYAIDLQTDGGVYQTVLTTKVSDKTSGRYERSHRIDLPKGKNWTVRVRRLTTNANNSLISDKMYVEAITEIIDAKLRYPNTAMLGLQYDAKTFSNVAKLSVRCRGKLIAVPTNYDPVARSYNGIWDGTFKIAYSNNPAWVFYDICTQWRYGLGNRLDKSMVDKWSLYRLAQYCDQFVSDGKGGQEPRFTVNVYLQSQQDAFTVLQSLSSIFRAMSYWQGEQIIVDADLPKDPVYTFSRANVVGGEFSYTGTRARDRHTVAKVAWDNPDQRFKTEYEWVRDEKAIVQHGVKVLDISLMGCTSQGQAQRAGLWALKSEQLETRTVSFKTGLEGFIPSVGSIINVSDEVLAGRANGGRIASVSADFLTVTLDREAVINAGDTLVVNGNSGQAQRRQVTKVLGRDVTVISAFDNIGTQNVWVVDSPDLKTMQFRVLSIAQNDDHTFGITALQHEPQKYAAIDYGAIVEPSNISIIQPTTIDSPASVTLSQRNRIEQGQNITTLIIAWEQVSGAVSYEIEWRKDDGNWLRLPHTGNNSVEIDGVYSGDYLVKVKAINAFDVMSAPTTSMLTTIVGKIGKPPVLVSLTATGLLFGMRLDWAFPQSAGDTNFTEIQVATAPDTNVSVLGQYAYPTNTATIQGLQGNLTQYYRGRLIDKLGNVGDWSVWVKGVTDASAGKVLDLLNGQITESQLYKDLNEKIAKITINSSAIAQEITDRQTAINAAVAGVNANIANQATATTASINQEIADRKKAVADVNTGLSNEVQNRLDATVAINTALSKEVQDRLNADSTINAAVTTEQKARSDADSALSSRIDTVTATSNDNKALIVSEQTTRANADGALSQRIDTVVTKTDNNQAAIVSEQTARSNADGALSSRIDSISAKSDSNQAAISNEQTTRANADNALSSRIDSVTATSNDNKALIVSEQTTRANADNALSTRIDTVVAKSDSNAALISTEQKARTEADSALSSRIDTNKATTDNKIAMAQESINTVTTAQSATAIKLDGVYAQLNPRMAGDDSKLAGDDTAFAGVWSEMSARIEGDSALSVRIDNVTANWNNNLAYVQTTTKATSDALSSLASQVTVLSAAVGGNVSLVMDNYYTKTTTDQVIAQKTEALKTEFIIPELDKKATTGAVTNVKSQIDNVANQLNIASLKLDGVYAQITPRMAGDDTAMAGDDSKYAGVWTETSARIEGDSAIGLRIDSLQATVGDNSANILTEQKVRADNDGALSQRIDTLNSSYQSNIATINNQLSTLTTAKDSQASSLSNLQASVNTAQSTANSGVTKADNAQNAANNAQNSANTAQGTANDAINRTASNLAAIQSEQKARADADSAIASSVTTLQASVAGNTASIQTAQSAINGLNAQYTVKLDVNGYVSGFGMANSGKTADFIVNANTFAIGTAGVNPKYAFVYKSTPETLSNGTVIPSGLYLDNAVIGKIDASKINADSLSAISANIGYFKSAPSGARLEIKDSLLSVYDSNNVLRVRMGVW